MARFFNTLLPLTALFFVSFTWLYYYTRLGTLSAVCGGAITLVLMIPLYLLAGKKNKKQRERMKKADAEKLAHHLACEGGEELFTQYFTLRGYQAEQRSNALLLTKGQQITLCKLCFSFAPLTADEVAKAAREGKKLKAQKTFVLCNSATPQAIATSSQFDTLTIKEVAWVYSTLKDAHLLPELSRAKKTPKALLAYALNASRSSLFFTSAAGLAFTSLFTYFPLYPLCFSLLLLIAGLYAKYNKRFNLAEE